MDSLLEILTSPMTYVIASAVVGVCAIIAAATPNKADDKVVDTLLKIVNFLGANFGKAKNAPEPENEATGGKRPIGGNFKAFAVLPALLAIALLLAGCGLPVALEKLPEDATTDELLEAVGKYTIADLDEAQRRAVLGGDEKAQACYPQIKKFVLELKPLLLKPDEKTVEGAFAAYQRFRNLRRRFEGGLFPTYVQIGCAAMVGESRRAVTRFLLNPKGFFLLPGS